MLLCTWTITGGTAHYCYRHIVYLRIEENEEVASFHRSERLASSSSSIGRSAIDILIDCLRDTIRWKERWEHAIEKKLEKLQKLSSPEKKMRKQRRLSTIDAYLEQGKYSAFPASVTKLAQPTMQRKSHLTSLVIMITPNEYIKAFLSDLTSWCVFFFNLS